MRRRNLNKPNPTDHSLQAYLKSRGAREMPQEWLDEYHRLAKECCDEIWEDMKRNARRVAEIRGGPPPLFGTSE